MKGAHPFEEHAQEYDRWFDSHVHLYQAEANALMRLIPARGLGVEIGVGSGRFAAPLGIKLGVEPSRRMAEIAAKRGIAVCQALGERLPFSKGQFDFVLLVTVLCFVSDMLVLLREIHRVLAPGGVLINGFINKDSALGREYESRKDQSMFYRSARFYSTDQVANASQQAGFGEMAFAETIIGFPDITPNFDRVQDGYGEGAFVVLSARKL